MFKKKTKVCTKCFKRKRINQFHKHTGRHGRKTEKSRCKTCSCKDQKEYCKKYPERKKKSDKFFYSTHQAYIKSYRALDRVRAAKSLSDERYRKNNKEKLSAYHKRVYLDNREEKIAAARRYAIINGEKVKAYQKKYRKTNRAAIIEMRKEWIKENAAWVKIKAMMNRARRRGAPGFFTSEQWNTLKSFFKHCPSCKKRKKLTVDHIIPLSWPNSTNWIWNIQPLCKPCNTGKCNHRATDYRPPEVIAWAERERFWTV